MISDLSGFTIVLTSSLIACLILSRVKSLEVLIFLMFPVWQKYLKNSRSVLALLRPCRGGGSDLLLCVIPAHAGTYRIKDGRFVKNL
jgi:hypothetical protein